MKILLNASLGKAELVRRLPLIAPEAMTVVDDHKAALAELASADGLICPDHFYTAELAAGVRANAGRLRWVQLLTAGYDHIKRHGTRPGVTVCNAGAAYAPVVATHAVALLLALQRQIPAILAVQPRRAWVRDFTARMTTPAGSTVAIIGFGPIGREIARLLRAFGAHIIAVTRSAKPDPLADEVARVKDIHTVLPRADVLILALPLDEASRHLIGAAEFALCRKTAVLINIARGAIVDQAALMTALQQGLIAGAGIDVTDPEPLPADDPLWGAPNLILSPHCAGACGPVAGERLAAVVCDNLRRFMAGQALDHVVTF